MTNNVIDLTTAQRIDARREVRRLSSIEARRTPVRQSLGTQIFGIGFDRHLAPSTTETVANGRQQVGDVLVAKPRRRAAPQIHGGRRQRRRLGRH